MSINYFSCPSDATKSSFNVETTKDGVSHQFEIKHDQVERVKNSHDRIITVGIIFSFKRLILVGAPHIAGIGPSGPWLPPLTAL